MHPPAPIVRSYCRRCRTATRQHLSGCENGDRPQTASYRCSACGYERLELGGPHGVTDAIALCWTVCEEYLRKTGAQIGQPLSSSLSR